MEMNIKCSKCKKTKENQYFVSMGKSFKTCSLCRWTARDRTTRRNIQRGMSMLSINYIDTDSVMSASADDPPDENDVAILIVAFQAVSLSSSSSAAACSSANYFVEEPEPEPGIPDDI
jgi:hypothetical protein